MKQLRWICVVLAFALLAACGAPQPEAAPELDPNVVGGRDADISEYPWMAAMVSAEDGIADTIDPDSEEEFIDVVPITDAPDENDLEQFCGGSLIADEWILSAAHCFAEAGAQLSYQGVNGEASVSGFADALIVEDDKSYTVPNQVAFEGLTGSVEFAGQVVLFLGENPEDDIDTSCAVNEAFQNSIETGQAIAVEVVEPDDALEAQALAQELGQETCSEEELEAAYGSNFEQGRVIEINSFTSPEFPEDLPEDPSSRQTDALETLDAGQLNMPVSSWRVSLQIFVGDEPTEQDLAAAAFLEALKTEGSLDINYSPDFIVDEPSGVSVMFGSESLNVGEFRASGGELVAVQELLVHPKYSPTSTGLTYDYALLRLENPVDRPTIALEQGRGEVAGDVATSVLGWGFTDGGAFPDEPDPEEDPEFPEDPEEDPDFPEDPEEDPEFPEEPGDEPIFPERVDLQVADNIMTLSDADCQARLEGLAEEFVIFPNPFDKIAPTILCTDTFSEEEQRALDACGGDSGGPLFREDEEGDFVQVGIVSFGFGLAADCGGEGDVAGYARVSTGARWIRRNVNLRDGVSP